MAGTVSHVLWDVAHSHVRGWWGQSGIVGQCLLSLQGAGGHLYCPQTPFRTILVCGWGKRERTRLLRCTPFVWSPCLYQTSFLEL